MEKTVIRKETKNKIRVDYEGKLSFKERMIKKLKASNTWIKTAVNICRFILMLGVSYVILYPFVAKIAGSFMTIDDVVSPTVALIPTNPTVNIYKTIWIENSYVEGFVTTLLLSLLCAFLQTFVACLIGYGLAKFKFKGNKVIMITVIVTMIIPHIALKSAMTQQLMNFDLFRIFAWNYKGPIEAIFGETLYLGQTFWPLVMLSATGLAFKNGLYIYLMRQFFKGVPDELEESAYIDGSGTFRTFVQIILPLSVPMMITIFLFAFSWQWTDNFYTTTSMFFPGRSQILLSKIVAIPKTLDTQYAGGNLYSAAIRNTCGLLILAPLIVVYLFCQRYLIQGIERSGITG